MTDGKEKDDRRYCHSYSNRLSTDGESEIWYMPSVSMRIDEKDEQCQSQEWNHDECVLRTKINGFGYGRSQILPLKWWWRVCDYDLKREYIPQIEGIVTNKVVIIKAVSPSVRAYDVPDCVVSTQVTISFNLHNDSMNSHYYF